MSALRGMVEGWYITQGQWELPGDTTINYPYPTLLLEFLLHFFGACEMLPIRDLLGTERILI